MPAVGCKLIALTFSSPSCSRNVVLLSIVAENIKRRHGRRATSGFARRWRRSYGGVQRSYSSTILQLQYFATSYRLPSTPIQILPSESPRPIESCSSRIFGSAHDNPPGEEDCPRENQHEPSCGRLGVPAGSHPSRQRRKVTQSSPVDEVSFGGSSLAQRF